MEDRVPHIVIIEDDFVLAEQLVVFFSRGYRVSFAHQFKEGIQLLEKEVPDLVITDILLPGGENGFDIIRFLRMNAAYLHVPILTISGLQEEEKVLSALQFGANDFIIKPISLQTLRWKVENLLAIVSHTTIQQVNKLTFDKKAAGMIENNFDLKFRQRFEQLISDTAYDVTLKVSDMAEYMNCSISTLERWCDKTYDMTPMKYILHLRLLKASVLLEQNYGRIKDVAYETGFSSLSYFSKCYKAKFGKSPSLAGPSSKVAGLAGLRPSKGSRMEA